MTATLTVGDRRRAALERLHGVPAAPVGASSTRSSGTSSGGSSARSSGASIGAKRQRRTAAEARARLGLGRTERRVTGPEVLGPPTGTYYAIASVVAVFVMLGLVMVLSASAVTE